MYFDKLISDLEHRTGVFSPLTPFRSEKNIQKELARSLPSAASGYYQQGLANQGLMGRTMAEQLGGNLRTQLAQQGDTLRQQLADQNRLGVANIYAGAQRYAADAGVNKAKWEAQQMAKLFESMNGGNSPTGNGPVFPSLSQTARPGQSQITDVTDQYSKSIYDLSGPEILRDYEAGKIEQNQAATLYRSWQAREEAKKKRKSIMDLIGNMFNSEAQ